MLMTAAVDGSNNRFSQQQHQLPRGVNPNSMPFNPGYAPRMLDPNQVPDQTMQMQMMQFELMRIQALQVQQMMAQAQHQQNRRASPGFVPPATAGPSATSFDLRSATLSAQLRRANQPDHAKSHLGVSGDDQVPMTAALGGKFGSRAANLVSSNGNNFGNDDIVPPTPNSTTVISGGTSLGNLSNTNINNSTPSKSDAAMSWRRGGNNNSVISGNNRVMSSPSVKITPPPGERVSPPPLPAIAKARPQPLQFNSFVSQSTDVVAVDTEAVDTEDAASSTSSKSAASNSPTTPPSPAHNQPLSPREQASKKLYEGLGLGRPATDSIVQPEIAHVNHRMVSQPVRQPRGPPSGADELGPKNFARMVRRKAIGGLGMLANARERREFVEAY
jgi:hypothetical protein